MAAIAARAGVGIGTLYRRHRTKEDLFQRLCVLALNDYLSAADEGFAERDPWDGVVYYVTHAVLTGTGALAPIAGTIDVDEMTEIGERGDAAATKLIARAHDAGVLRADVGAVDIALLIEQLGRSPLVEQVTKQGHTDLLESAQHARHRIITIALDGLRAPAATPQPSPQPGWELLSRRWTVTDAR